MQILLASLVSLVLAVPARVQDPAVAQAVPERPAARALLVGCTQYPYLKAAGVAPGSNTIELRGPTNDVELFARVLHEVYGVPEAALTRLVGWPDDEKARPTRSNILSAFRNLARDARAGEWVVVFLAGHGSQQPSSTASLDDETDGLDEIFLPADVRPSVDGAKVPNALVDDEIAQLVAAIQQKGSEVWLVVDACHSGTLLRGGDHVVRGLPAASLGVRGTTPRPPATAVAPAARAPSQGVAAFYGAQSFGSAPEMDLPEGGSDARPQGLFTYLLVREMRRTGASTTYAELAQRVISAYQSFPCHLTVPMAQGDLDRVVGGGGRVVDPPLLVEFGAGAPRIDQGILHGIENGTVLAVLADGAAPDAAPIAEIEVTDAGSYDAACAVRTGAAPKEAVTLRARVVKRPVGEFTLVLGIESLTGAPLGLETLPESVRAFLAAADGKFRVTAVRSEADWRIVADGEQFQLRAAEHVGAPDVFDVAPTRLALMLERIRRASGMRRVCGLFDATDPGFAVWIEHRRGARGTVRRLSAGESIAPGDEVRVLLEKSGGGIVDANVYFIDANYGLKRLFPLAGQSPRLEPKAGSEFELVPWTPVVDDALGVESLWVLAVPRGPSDPVLALRDLSQDPTTTRGMAEEKAARGLLEELLSEPATRGLATANEAPTKRGSVFQVPLLTTWSDLGAPDWKAEHPATAAGDLAFLAGLPVPIEVGPCFEFATSAAPGARDDVLLLGDAAGPHAVFVDFSAPSAKSPVIPADFEPEAAFLFLPDGRRLALYDRRDQGSFDLCLLDADGDGNAESRWTRTGAEWILQGGVRTPWLSQANLAKSVIGDKPANATARLSVLSRRSRP